jgi:hypothetical protein
VLELDAHALVLLSYTMHLPFTSNTMLALSLGLLLCKSKRMEELACKDDVELYRHIGKKT